MGRLLKSLQYAPATSKGKKDQTQDNEGESSRQERVKGRRQEPPRCPKEAE